MTYIYLHHLRVEFYDKGWDGWEAAPQLARAQALRCRPCRRHRLPPFRRLTPVTLPSLSSKSSKGNGGFRGVPQNGWFIRENPI